MKTDSDILNLSTLEGYGAIVHIPFVNRNVCIVDFPAYQNSTRLLQKPMYML